MFATKSRRTCYRCQELLNKRLARERRVRDMHLGWLQKVTDEELAAEVQRRSKNNPTFNAG